jgi:serine/threonine protein kinase
MKIALGMARGLEYLHHTHSPPVVHSCFKTANVLLDHDLVPKISDVAVAKLFPQGADKQVGRGRPKVGGGDGDVPRCWVLAFLVLWTVCVPSQWLLCNVLH